MSGKFYFLQGRRNVKAFERCVKEKFHIKDQPGKERDILYYHYSKYSRVLKTFEEKNLFPSLSRCYNIKYPTSEQTNNGICLNYGNTILLS